MQAVDDEFTRSAQSSGMASDAVAEAEHRVIEELGAKRRLLMAVNESKEHPVRHSVSYQDMTAVGWQMRGMEGRGLGSLFHRPPSLSSVQCYNGQDLRRKRGTTPARLLFSCGRGLG